MQHIGEQAGNTAKQHYSKSNSQPSVSLQALMLAFAEPLKGFSSIFKGAGLLAGCNTSNQSRAPQPTSWAFPESQVGQHASWTHRNVVLQVNSGLAFCYTIWLHPCCASYYPE